MSGTRNIKVRSKKKLKKKFLLTSKKCWMIDEKLIPLYQHLVDEYSIKVREEWNVKVEVSDVVVAQQVKEEPPDDNLVDPQDDAFEGWQLFQHHSSTNQIKVFLSHCDSSPGHRKT